MDYVVNVDSGVVHRPHCPKGPNRDDVRSKYEKVPEVLIPSLPGGAFCYPCCAVERSAAVWWRHQAVSA